MLKKKVQKRPPTLFTPGTLQQFDDEVDLDAKRVASNRSDSVGAESVTSDNSCQGFGSDSDKEMSETSMKDAPRCLVPEQKLQETVELLAAKIMKVLTPLCNQTSKPITFVCLIKGAVPFFVDLTRLLHFPIHQVYIRAVSYGAATVSSGEVSISMDASEEKYIRNHHVVVVDDIFDSGRTLMEVQQYLQRQNPLSIRCCVLLYKNVQRRDLSVSKPDFIGMDIGDEFVFGYGMNLGDNRFRHLPDIFSVQMGHDIDFKDVMRERQKLATNHKPIYSHKKMEYEMLLSQVDHCMSFVVRLTFLILFLFFILGLRLVVSLIPYIYTGIWEFLHTTEPQRTDIICMPPIL